MAEPDRLNSSISPTHSPAFNQCPTRNAALRWPHATALWLSRERAESEASGESAIRLSFLQLDHLVSAACRWMESQQLRTGAHIGVLSHNSPAVVVLLLACIRSQRVLCPLNPRFSDSQIQHQQTVQQLSCLLHESRLAELWQQWSEESAGVSGDTTNRDNDRISIDGEQPCDMILTSGSSGRPKAVVHCLRNHVCSALGSAQRLVLAPGDCWLLSLPLFHIGGYAIVIRSLLAGSALALGNSQQTLAEQISRWPITHISLVNAQLYRLLHHSRQLLENSALRHMLLGGGPVNGSLTEQVRQLGITTWTTWGMTEMSSQISTGPWLDGPMHAGSLLPGRELKTDAEDQLLVRGDCLALGYFTPDGIQPLETLPASGTDSSTEAGWFATGDRGVIADGLVTVAGRCDNQFISGGENIQPEQIEQCLCQHPAVGQALVVPVEHPEYGMRPFAFIDWRGEPRPAELRQWLRRQLAGFLCPDHFACWPADLVAGGLKPSRKAFRQRAAELSDNSAAG